MIENFKDQFERPRAVDEIQAQCEANGIELRRTAYDSGEPYVAIVSGDEDTGIATVIYRPESGRFNGVTNLGESFDSDMLNGYAKTSWFEALALFFWVPRAAGPDAAHNRRADDVGQVVEAEPISLKIGDVCETGGGDIVTILGEDNGGNETPLYGLIKDKDGRIVGEGYFDKVGRSARKENQDSNIIKVLRNEPIDYEEL